MPLVWVVMLGVGLVAAACGSGGESPQPTGTATSERVERQATVSEQQIQQEVDDAETVQQVQQVEQAEQAGQETGQAQQVQVEEEDIKDEPQADELPTAIVGTHKGVRSEGRVLGELEAPVLIEHFGDFT